jgi:TolB-like protein
VFPKRCIASSRAASRNHRRRVISARDLHSDLTAARREIESGAGRSAAGADAEQAIAVLPFQNMSADPENEYFGDGIAEEIINALTQIDGLRVAGRTSSFSFKGKSAAIGEIAEKLKVRHVLEGSTTRLDEGVDEARRAVGFDPLSGYATACYAYALSQARRTSEAVIQARLAVQRDRESFIAWWALGNACQWDGRFDEAIDAYEHLLRASSRHPWPLAGLAATYANMGRLGEARALHAELLAQRATGFVQPTMLAMSASAAGDHEAAMLFCHECVEERDVLFGIFYQHYVDLDRIVPMRDSPTSWRNSTKVQRIPFREFVRFGSSAPDAEAVPSVKPFRSLRIRFAPTRNVEYIRNPWIRDTRHRS